MEANHHESNESASIDATTLALADRKVLLTRQSAIAEIRFNNPEKRNAMSMEMWEAFAFALNEVRQDSRCRVLILAGAGGKAFVSGADISQFESKRNTLEQREEYARRTGVWRGILGSFPIPTIACIRGFCLGGGLNVALSCDIRIAAEGSHFGVPAAKLSIAYDYHGLRRLTQLIGPSWARLLMFTAMRIDGREAERIGLINRLVPDMELETATIGIAQQIASAAPLSVAASRISIEQILKDPADRDMDAVAAIALHCATSEDAVEGRRAFLEKRPAQFHGR